MLKAIDLCGGAGGWAVAARGLPIEIVLAVDYWQPAVESYRLNHPQVEVWQADMTKADTAQRVRDFAKQHGVSIVLGGIPCSWLTVMRRKGLGNDTTQIEIDEGRALLDALLAITAELKPRYWCFEDVVGIVKELPPLTPYEILDASCWSPQRRRRAFVGRFPKPKNPRDKRLLRDAIRPCPYRIGPRAADRTPTRTHTYTNRTSYGSVLDDKSATVTAWTSRRDGEIVVVDDSLPGGKRQFEWQEGAILQGFPTDYVFWGSPQDVAILVSQAIQIDLGRAILHRMCQQLQAEQTAALEAVAR